jgi:uncharacterized protein YcfJ
MKTRHILISIGAAALAGTAAMAQTVATQTTTRTVHTTTTTSASGRSGQVRHRTVTYRHRAAPRRYVRSRGSANRTASRTTTTTTVTTVQHPERYDYNRPDPAAGGYYADRYYRDAPQYNERVLSESDRVYVGRDNRYYCRRSDGTTGLIVGGLAGGVLGNVLTSGRSETLGTLLGGAAGALAGRQIDRSSVRCR